MDILMVIFRLFHIFSGVLWVGAALFMMLAIMPAVAQAGPAGGAFMRAMLLKTPYGILFPVGSILTVVSGVLMFWTTSNHLNGDWFSDAGNILLTVGAISGILAFGHAMSTLSPTTRKLKKLMQDLPEGAPPPADKMGELQALQQKLATNARISMVMMIIAVIGMSAWRYI